MVGKVKMLAQSMGGTIKVGLSLAHPYLDPAIDLMSPIAPHLYSRFVGSYELAYEAWNCQFYHIHFVLMILNGMMAVQECIGQAKAFEDLITSMADLYSMIDSVPIRKQFSVPKMSPT